MTLSVALQHRFEGFALDVTFEAPPGVTVLFGPSGSGKTTIVNALAGLLAPDQGRIVADGNVLLDTDRRITLPPHRRRIGYVFQEGRLFPHLTVRQNLTYGRFFAPRSERIGSIDQIVDLLGIGHLLDRRPGALSGGEKSRVAIGRALLASPRLLLADEPLASLDEARRAEILPYFERLRDELAIPILYVSHSSAEVARLATIVVALRDGRIASIGPAADVLGDVSVVGARGAASLIVAKVVSHHEDGLSELAIDAGRLWLPRVPEAPGSTIRVRIAAQDIILARERPTGLSALNILTGTIVDMRQGSGPGVLVTLALGQDKLLARITRRSANTLDLAPGQSCHAIIKTVAISPQDVGAGKIERSD